MRQARVPVDDDDVEPQVCVIEVRRPSHFYMFVSVCVSVFVHVHVHLHKLHE